MKQTPSKPGMSKAPSSARPTNMKGNSGLPTGTSKSMQHCSKLGQPVVPKMGSGGIKF